jgi:membrane protein
MDKGTWQIPKKAFLLLKRNDPLRMAGATAFFTSFSLPFILIIFIQLFGLVLNRHEFSQQLFRSLSGILGDPGGQQIRDISRRFRRLATTEFIAVGGFIFLLFVVTTLFKVIKDSIHQLWQAAPTDGKWLDVLLPRIRSIVLILFGGVLFLVGLAIGSFLAAVRHSIGAPGPLILLVLQQFIFFVIATCWITSLFLYLPDERFSFNVSVKGAALTGLLFVVGKWLLRWLLVSSNIGQIYGTAGAFVVVLLFVFYIAFILYYGAAFTAVLAEEGREVLRPGVNARLVKQ